MSCWPGWVREKVYFIPFLLFLRIKCQGRRELLQLLPGIILATGFFSSLCEECGPHLNRGWSGLTQTKFKVSHFHFLHSHSHPTPSSIRPKSSQTLYKFESYVFRLNSSFRTNLNDVLWRRLKLDSCHHHRCCWHGLPSHFMPRCLARSGILRIIVYMALTMMMGMSLLSSTSLSSSLS